MIIIYNKSDYLTKVSDIEAEQLCRIKYWQFNKQVGRSWADVDVFLNLCEAFLKLQIVDCGSKLSYPQ